MANLMILTYPVISQHQFEVEEAQIFTLAQNRDLLTSGDVIEVSGYIYLTPGSRPFQDLSYDTKYA